METFSCIHTRTSVRSYRDTPIPEEILEKVLRAGQRAPSGGNLQNYSIILTEDRARRRELAEIHFQQKWLLEAPVILTICVDISRTARRLAKRGIESGFSNFWGFLVAMADAWSVAQNISLAAHASGLGTCHSGATFQKTLNLIEFFGCPKGVIPVATLALGYAAAESDPVPRLDLVVIASQERYKTLTDEELEEDYAEKERVDWEFYQSHMGPLPPGIDSWAAIYGRMKYPKAEMDLFGENFLVALKKQGFLP